MQGWRVVLNPIQFDGMFKHAASLLLSQVGDLSKNLDGPGADTFFGKGPVTAHADA
jgi:hypothetical protein